MTKEELKQKIRDRLSDCKAIADYCSDDPYVAIYFNTLMEKVIEPVFDEMNNK